MILKQFRFRPAGGTYGSLLMKRLFSAACLTALIAAVGWSQEQPQSATKEELKNLHQAIVDRAYITTLDSALLDLSGSLIANNGLGIDVARPDAALRAQLGLGEDAGLVVIAAPEESPGAKAGLKVHDVLIQFDAEKLGDAQRLAEWLGAADGKTVKLRVLRSGKPLEIQVTPKKPDSNKALWLDYVLASSESYRI